MQDRVAWRVDHLLQDWVSWTTQQLMEICLPQPHVALFSLGTQLASCKTSLWVQKAKLKAKTKAFSDKQELRTILSRSSLKNIEGISSS